jgi:hypothetical protein
MITQTTTTSFKVELLQAVHSFGPTTPDTFKIALYTAAATIDSTTTVYTVTGEVVGAGYTAGGNTLAISTSPTSGNNTASIPTAFVSFSNTSWASSTITARGALIYNSTQGNKSVAVLDFGADKTTANTTFLNHLPNRRRFQRNCANFIRTNMLVTTTKGDMDDSLLEKREGTVDNDNETTTWVEYWLDEELVHRSAHVRLKKTVTLTSSVASF